MMRAARRGGPAPGRLHAVFDRVQVLRFVAATLVVAFHVNLAALSYLPRGAHAPPLMYGWVGVDIFFVISGFIIVHTTRTREPAAGLFLLRRVERIVPIYWITTFISFAILNMPALVRTNHLATASDLVHSLLFVTWASQPHHAPLVHVGWTLEWEMLFYLLFAAGLLVARRRGWNATWIAAVPLIAAVVLLRLGAVPATAFWRFVGEPQVLEFCYGMALARLVGEGRRALPFALVCLAAGALVWSTRAAAAGWPAFVLVLWAVRRDMATPLTGRVGRALAWLGDASYSIYLAQVFPISGMMKAMARFTPGIPPNLATIFATVGCLLLGVLLYVLVEQPLRVAIRRITARRRVKPPAAAASAG